MKIYVATRFGRKDEVKKIYKKLIDNGHEISADWTVHQNMRPYENNERISEEYAIKDIEGVKNCEAFILLSDEGGQGMFVELGTAILSNLLYGRPKIFVVGEHNSNCLFFFHPSVMRKNSIEDVLKELE